MRFLRYLSERLINKDPQININPTLGEITTMLKRSDYEMVRSLVHKKTGNMYIWDGGVKTHLYMFAYMIENGIVDAVMEDAEQYYVVVIMTGDDREEIRIEVKDWKRYQLIPYKKIPRLKRIFPNATDMEMK